MLTMYEPAATGVGQSFCAVRDAIGQERIDKAQVILFTHATTNGTGLGMMRIVPKGQPYDSIEGLAWVPQKWLQGGVLPEALRDHGAPWLLVGQAGSLRDARKGWPFPGVGHMLTVITGHVFHASWPLRAATDLGPEPQSSWDFLCSLPLATFAKFASENITHAVLPPGSCMWVPFGRMSCALTLITDGQHSTMLYAPWMNGQLAAACPEKHTWTAWSMLRVDCHIASDLKPWTLLGAGFKAWLESVHPPLAGQIATSDTAADTLADPAAEGDKHDFT